MLALKPLQKRRLAAEQAIYRRFNNFTDCAIACQKKADAMGVDVTFNRLSIQQYVGVQTNLSVRRLKVLAELLGVTNYSELDEVFTAPRHRGEGDWWIGQNGNKVKDIDMTMMNNTYLYR